MLNGDIQPLLDLPMQLGESPLWHPDEAALYWIDIAGQAVHRFHPQSRHHQQWTLPSEPGCIARCEDGGLVVAMRSGICLLDTHNGVLTPLLSPPYDPRVSRFNDGRCDAAGRLWVGSLYDSRDRPGGSLFCLERGRIRDAARPVTVSNGIAFGIDDQTLYHADTTAHRISIYAYDLSTGEVGEGRVFHQFSTDRSTHYGGRPDGAAVDSEGAYWCAMYEGGRLLRLAGTTGEVLDEIALPVRCPTMMAFGGEDLRTLYVTTARHHRPAGELSRHPLSGHVLVMRVSVPGRIDPAYRP